MSAAEEIPHRPGISRFTGGGVYIAAGTLTASASDITHNLASAGTGPAVLLLSPSLKQVSCESARLPGGHAMGRP
jgi:hypothetical protein